MPLNNAQKEAVEYLEGPLLVLAGPGTGKTQLLSNKVEYILKETDLSPENILCLTFTESGASNIRDRLYSLISRAASKVAIHTYHSFGTDLLSAYKNYNPEFARNLDSAADEITRYKIVQNIQESLPGTDILRGDSISDILSTISSAKSARLSADDLRKIAEDNLKTSAKMEPELSAVLRDCYPRMPFSEALDEVYRPMLEIFAKYINKDPLAPGVEKEVNTYLLELNSLVDAELAKEKPLVGELNKWRNRRFEKDEKGNYRLANLVANKKLLSLADIMEQYDNTLRAEGLFDYDDMIEESIQILKTDAGFRATLSERFQYVLLDEFQGTNPSQAELVHLLTDYEKPNVMAVGDDDQAIFEFQGAFASNFLDFSNHYRPKIIWLKENYRSTKPILDFSRKIADQLESSFAKENGADKQLVAHQDLPTEISRHEFLSADGEYYWLAEKIAGLIKSGVPQKEIAIIAPKHKYILPLLPYLKSKKGLNVTYEKRDNLFEEPRLRELLILARFVNDLASEKNPSEKLLEILSFPFWGVSPLNAIKAVKNDKNKTTLDYLTTSEDEKIQKVGALLAELAAKSFEAPLELFLDYLTGAAPLSETLTSPFLNYYAKDNPDYATFELYEHLNVLRASALGYLKTVERPRLKDFIRYLDDYDSAHASLMNTSPYQDSENSVQILTAHKAKGLEFDHVFLIAVDNDSWGKGKGNNNRLVLPPNLVQIRHTGATEDERLRLLFVAITRAKTHLYLTNSLTDFSGKTPKRLDYLAEYEDKSGQILSPLLETAVETHYEDLEAAKKQTDLRLSWISAYKTLTPELKPILLKRLENYKLSATDLTDFLDIVYSGPTEFYKNKVLQAPREPANPALVFGTLVHSAFENVTNHHLTDAEAVENFRAEVLKLQTTPEVQRRMLERGVASLEKSLQVFGGILRAENSLGEVAFYHEPLALDGVPLTGKIDHIAVNKTAKTIEVYDFKTGNFHPEKWQSNTTLYKYMLQLGFYKLLLNLSPTYQNYRVERAHILFVTPDPHEEVHDKIYDFNAADEEKLKNLVRAVYRQIKTLAFVDDPELFVAPNEKFGISGIKDFCDLIIAKNEEM